MGVLLKYIRKWWKKHIIDDDPYESENNWR